MITTIRFPSGATITHPGLPPHIGEVISRDGAPWYVRAIAVDLGAAAATADVFSLRSVDIHHFRTRRGRGVSRSAKRRRHRAEMRRVYDWRPAAHDDQVDAVMFAWSAVAS